MKADLIKEFNLPGYIKGKSFAEASKAIESKFSERNDEAAVETKAELMGRLAKAQEYVKMQESLKANASQVPDMMNGQVPEGFEEFAPQEGQMAFGGVIGEGLAEDATTEQQNAAMSGGLGMASTGLELGMQAFGDTGVDASGLAGRQEKGNVAMGALGSAAKGAQAGMALGPWGAAAGAVIGGAAGLIGGSKANKKIQEGNRNASIIESNKYSNDFAWGGFATTEDPPTKNKGVAPTLPADSRIPVAVDPNRVIERAARSGGIMGVPYTGTPYARNPEPAPRVVTPGEPYDHSTPPAGIADGQFTNVPRVPDPVPPTYGPRDPRSMSIFERAPHSGEYPEGVTPTTTQPDAQAAQTAQTSINGTVTEEEATPAQRKAIEALGLKYKNTPVLGPTLEESAKATTDKFAADEAQKLAMAEKVQGVLDQHKANKPRNPINASRLAEFAPAAMSALQLATLEKPKRESLDRVDSRYKTDYVDEKALENRVQNEHNNVSRALAGATNGSVGALRSNLLGANKNKIEAMNDAYLKADDINRQEDRAAQQFNSRNDMINLQQSNREKENAARDEGAYKTNRSMLQSTLAENIGAIGTQATDRKTVAKMFGYDVEGEYVVGKDGKKKSWKEFQKEVKAYKKKTK